MRFLCVCVCVTLCLIGCYDADAKEKQSKEIPTVISKRGKLLLEDDFSEQDILWQFDAKECQYNIVKGALVTRSKCGASATALKREITPAYDTILEVKTILPMNAYLSVMTYGGQIAAKVNGAVAPYNKTFYIQTYTSEEGNKTVSMSALSYSKPRWVSILFEAIEGNYALTVDGKTVRWEQVPYEKVERSSVRIAPMMPASGQVVAIDDVKVWEALPKDPEPEKDKKGRK